jgi:homopolymeric O-antigen transport system permease protein
MSSEPLDLRAASPVEPERPARAREPAPTRTIRPTSGWAPLDLAELWRHRDLVFLMALRDVQLRYRQTLLGVTWAVLQPLAATFIFTILFGRLARLPSDGVPYAVFALTGLVPWQLFAYAMQQSSNSLVDNRHILSKVYFPRVIIPVASVGAGVLDFVVSLALLAAALAWFDVAIGWRVVAALPLSLLAIVSALGVGLWLATLHVRYRDIRATLPFLTQLWLFATPVVYPASLVPERWRPFLGVNPMAGVVEGFRWALLGTGPLSATLMAVSVASAAALLVSGLYYFRRMERSFADVI